MNQHLAAKYAWGQVLIYLRCSYHTRQLSFGTMGVPTLHPKAEAKPGWLTMAPLARKWLGEWGSVRTWLRTLSGRAFSHQFWA
jgi:hypothetical protein